MELFVDLPTRLSGDRGYDSDALDDTLMATHGIEMIAAQRRGRAHPGGSVDPSRPRPSES